jgi:hypothetical protein
MLQVLPRRILVFIAAAAAAEKLLPSKSANSRRKITISTQRLKALFAGAWLYMLITGRNKRGLKRQRRQSARFHNAPKSRRYRTQSL